MGRRHRAALRDRDPGSLLTDDRALAVALARELLHRSGALRVSIALDATPPAVVECERFGPIIVHDQSGELELPHAAGADESAPADLPLIRRLPPFEVDAGSGEIAGVLGGLEMLGRAVRGLAALLAGRSVVAAEYETTDPDTVLGLAGRAGEAVVVLLGEHEFELDP